MKTTYDQASSLCPECGSRKIIQDGGSGETVCEGCGLVIAEPAINTGPEWRAFTQKEIETRTRVGLPLSFSVHDKGLSTTIGPIDRDALGKRIPQETKYKMLRLKRWNTRARRNASVDRNLAHALGELQKTSEKLHIPSIVQERAALIYRKALKKGVIRGRSISSMVLASLYVACRMTQTPRTLDEVARHSPLDKKDIARCYRILLKELNLRTPVPNAQLRVPKIASDVELGEETQRMALEILGEAERLKITGGKAPMGMAAAALYLACRMNGENRTQKMLAEASGVTEVTIRNRYTELKRLLDLDVLKLERG
jgi:transcription initiation factor TFIIB